MKKARNHATKFTKLAGGTAAVMLALVIADTTSVFAQDDNEEISFDGLERVEGSSVAIAYIDPEVATFAPATWRESKPTSRRFSRKS